MSDPLDAVFGFIGSIFGGNDEEATPPPVDSAAAQLDIEGAKLRAGKRRRQRLLRTGAQDDETLGAAAEGAPNENSTKPKKLLGR